jgi:dihydrofolate synthase/folylpolyglutamate synthase
MADHARSDDAAVQAQLDRLAALSPGRDILGLERISAILHRIGDPQLRLPPVFHVAGTNGKGSTCAVLRAALETEGLKVHAYTSPHLVRFNERIRLSGALIDDAALAHYLREVLDHAADLSASFFEVTTAAALLAFAETPADACIIEVGLGGRLDATNVIPAPAACGIARLGVDHEAFLGSDPAGIAREKAGIARAGRPLVTLAYPFEIRAAVADVAVAAGAVLHREGQEWAWARFGDTLRVVVDGETIEASAPALPGAHQSANAALAIAMIRAQTVVRVSRTALTEAPARAVWPARLQRLTTGALHDALPDRTELWLDGGHNPDAATAIAAHFADGPPVDAVIGMLANKDAAQFLSILAPVLCSVTTVPIPGHEHHAPETLADMARAAGISRASTAGDLSDAIAHIAAAGAGECAAILGSLYLAGEALRISEALPQ